MGVKISFMVNLSNHLLLHPFVLNLPKAPSLLPFVLSLSKDLPSTPPLPPRQEHKSALSFRERAGVRASKTPLPPRRAKSLPLAKAGAGPVLSRVEGMRVKTQKTSTGTPCHRTTPCPQTHPILPILSILLSPRPKPASAAPNMLQWYPQVGTRRFDRGPSLQDCRSRRHAPR